MQIAALWGDAVSTAASLAWHSFQAINRAIPDKPFHPRWAPAPMLKQRIAPFRNSGSRGKPIRCVPSASSTCGIGLSRAMWTGRCS